MNAEAFHYSVVAFKHYNGDVDELDGYWTVNRGFHEWVDCSESSSNQEYLDGKWWRVTD